MNAASACAAGLLGFANVVLAARLVTVQRASLPLSGDISAPREIESTLRRSCYDCHSNETRWPWYSGVAPLSWLIARDVELGRREVNFSEWNSYRPITRRRKLQWIERALREEVMPPAWYRLLHPEARLTRAEREALERWSEWEISRLSPASPAN
jgi:heme-binding protein